MKHVIKKIIVCWAVVHQCSIWAISVVYNFRIAQITKQPIVEQSHRKHSIIALLFDVYQKKYHGDITQNFVGALGAYLYSIQSWYARVDCAFSHIHEIKNHTTSFSDTETDDILFTVGYNHKIKEKAQITFSGLFGIPTHNLLRLRHVDFGYSQIGTGLQCDGSYGLTRKTTMLYGVRYIYFIPRKAEDNNCVIHTFTIGNIADMLLAIKHDWAHQGIELGYTHRAQFGARCTPILDNITQKTNYIRDNFYIVYKYKFEYGSVAHRFLCNFSYGFDQHPKRYGNKLIITVWGSWNIRF